MGSLAKLTHRFIETATGDEIIVMRIESGDFFDLSGTSIAAWRLIDGKRNRADVVGALAHQFHVDRPQLEADIDQLLGQLKDSGLVTEG